MDGSNVLPVGGLTFGEEQEKIPAFFSYYSIFFGIAEIECHKGIDANWGIRRSLSFVLHFHEIQVMKSFLSILAVILRQSFRRLPQAKTSLTTFGLCRIKNPGQKEANLL